MSGANCYRFRHQAAVLTRFVNNNKQRILSRGHISGAGRPDSIRSDRILAEHLCAGCRVQSVCGRAASALFGVAVTLCFCCCSCCFVVAVVLLFFVVLFLLFCCCCCRFVAAIVLLFCCCCCFVAAVVLLLLLLFCCCCCFVIAAFVVFYYCCFLLFYCCCCIVFVCFLLLLLLLLLLQQCGLVQLILHLQFQNFKTFNFYHGILGRRATDIRVAPAIPCC